MLRIYILKGTMKLKHTKEKRRENHSLDIDFSMDNREIELRSDCGMNREMNNPSEISN